MKKKFSKKELEYFTLGNPLYPSKAKTNKVLKEKEEYLRSLGATDEQIKEGDYLCPEEFWFYACDVIADLAQEILDLKEQKFDCWAEFIEDIEHSLDQLAREVKKLNK
jgi:hypothetical protein